MCSVEGIKTCFGGWRWDLDHLGRRPTRGPIPVYGRRSFEPLTQVVREHIVENLHMGMRQGAEAGRWLNRAFRVRGEGEPGRKRRRRWRSAPRRSRPSPRRGGILPRDLAGYPRHRAVPSRVDRADADIPGSSPTCG
jgi:hypothetical protein